MKSLTMESIDDAMRILREAAEKLAKVGVTASTVPLQNLDDGGLGIALFVGCDVNSLNAQETTSLQEGSEKVPFDLITIEQNSNSSCISYSWKGTVLCTQKITRRVLCDNSILILENIEGQCKL